MFTNQTTRTNLCSKYCKSFVRHNDLKIMDISEMRNAMTNFKDNSISTHTMTCHTYILLLCCDTTEMEHASQSLAVRTAETNFVSWQQIWNQFLLIKKLYGRLKIEFEVNLQTKACGQFPRHPSLLYLWCASSKGFMEIRTWSVRNVKIKIWYANQGWKVSLIKCAKCTKWYQIGNSLV